MSSVSVSLTSDFDRLGKTAGKITSVCFSVLDNVMRLTSSNGCCLVLASFQSCVNVLDDGVQLHHMVDICVSVSLSSDFERFGQERLRAKFLSSICSVCFHNTKPHQQDCIFVHVLLTPRVCIYIDTHSPVCQYFFDLIRFSKRLVTNMCIFSLSHHAKIMCCCWEQTCLFIC
jgi:hypothetical protein